MQPAWGVAVRKIESVQREAIAAPLEACGGARRRKTVALVQWLNVGKPFWTWRY